MNYKTYKQQKIKSNNNNNKNPGFLKILIKQVIPCEDLSGKNKERECTNT